jgi:hypothetical protein
LEVNAEFAIQIEKPILRRPALYGSRPSFHGNRAAAILDPLLAIEVVKYW